MGTMIAENDAPAVTEELADYRTVSRSAIVSAVLALPAAIVVLYSISTTLGLEALPLVFLLTLPGLILASVGLTSIRRYPNEYTGKTVAIFGLATHAALLLVSIPSHAYIQATEVPEGYERISFAQLQPDPQKGEYGLPKQAFDLVGKPVFIKGYIHPGVSSMGKVDNFVLVPDMGTCCFGGQPKPTDMVEIKIVAKAPRVKWSTRTVRLAGKFALVPPKPDTLGLQNVVYYLEADYVRP